MTAEKETTLRDVLEWQRDAFMCIATFVPPSARPDALEAINRLTDMARRALDSPTADGLIWAIRNDPVAWAAYNHGRRSAGLPSDDPMRLRVERGALSDIPPDLQRRLNESL